MSPPRGSVSPFPAWFVKISEAAGRGLLIALALIAVIWLLARLRLVVFPVLGALLLATVLVPPANALRQRGWPSLAATWVVVGGFFALMAGLVWLIVPVVIDEFDELGPVLASAVDDLERWAVQGPLGLDADQLENMRTRLGEELGDFLSAETVLVGVVLVGEVIAGIVLMIILTFFVVKDGPRMQAWLLDHLPRARRPAAAEAGSSAFSALGGYVLGASIIGLVEAVAFAVVLMLLGANLVLPIAVVTFFGAFVPIAGAWIAGLLAVGVAFAAGGVTAAVIMAVVAVVVQQFSDDLLAPIIYGKITRLHPVVVLLAITAGASLAGISGIVLAMPVAVVTVSAGGVMWRRVVANG